MAPCLSLLCRRYLQHIRTCLSITLGTCSELLKSCAVMTTCFSIMHGTIYGLVLCGSRHLSTQPGLEACPRAKPLTSNFALCQGSLSNIQLCIYHAIPGYDQQVHASSWDHGIAELVCYTGPSARRCFSNMQPLYCRRTANDT